ncbi:epoxide hydrolase 1 isoform X4 [Centroberyx affinis]|uniref:epoxide hydrolase 1 isoform X4 n=1 Tax=Centroberyx affinis TaxID=166261 RepID=UPI003A5C0AFA
MFTEVLVGLVIAGLIFFLVQRSKTQVLKTEDGWWGPGVPPEDGEDFTIRPYKVTTGDEELEDLYRRIDQTRPIPSLEDSQFNYGFNSQYLQKVVSYWRNDFDWRRQVDKLNQYPHFKTNIEGFDSVCAARVFHKLMKRLGFQQFYAHGGDWGWLITTNMSQLEPKIVKGLHVNFAPPSKPGLPMILSIMLGRRFPKLFGFTDMDIERLYPCMEKLVVESIKESGYMHIQATKPDTVGRGLNDSPVGLAAYILEKFSTWTDHDFRSLDDGGLTRKFSLDDLLTNVMIYWTSGCIISSMRFYKENFSKGLNQPHEKIPVHVPTGFACFPNELMHTPKLWVKQKYRKLKTFTPMASGGHFAAMEEPQLMARDIQSFTKTLEKKKKK